MGRGELPERGGAQRREPRQGVGQDRRAGGVELALAAARASGRREDADGRHEGAGGRSRRGGFCR